jgi:hypothetical protein
MGALSHDGYTPGQAQAFFAKLPERLRSAPAVNSFALAAQPPICRVGIQIFILRSSMLTRRRL